MAAALKVRLPPSNGDMEGCCVPIDALLKFSHTHVTQRRLARNFAFFAIYLIILYVCFIPAELYFMSNSRAIADMMHWNVALTPQRIVETLDANSQFSTAQWWGPANAGHEIKSWREYETWAQTRMLFYERCDAGDPWKTCLAPALAQQSQSNLYSSCVDTNEELVCMDAQVTSPNCFNGAFGNVLFDSAPIDSEAACVPAGLGLYFACGLKNEGWVVSQVDSSSVQQVATAFNAKTTLNATSRTLTVSETLLYEPQHVFQSSSFQAGQLLSGMFSFTPRVISVPFTPNATLSPAAVLLCIVVTVDILLFFRRCILHPNTFWGPWVVLDLIMLAMYGLLYYSLTFVWGNNIQVTTSGNTDATLNCAAVDETLERAYTTQFFGALLGISFIQILRFLSQLPLLSLTLSSLMRTFKNAGGTLFVILIVYMLNALSVMIFFGSQSPVFLYYGGAFFSTIILPEGFDVNFIGQQMRFARPNDDIPSFYNSLVVFVVNRCVTSTVTAFVCIVYWMEKKRFDREAQQIVDDNGGGGNSFTARQMFWYLYYELVGKRPYENVDVETAYERLFRFSREKENLLRNFITYEEILFCIGIAPGKVGVRTRVQKKQVEELMRLCGPGNIYLNSDARRCEAKWSEQVRYEGGSRVFKRKTFNQIALFTCRATLVEKEKGLTIKTCIQTSQALRVKQHQQLFYQKVEPLCMETLDRQEKLSLDLARLELHHDLVFNILPRLGLVMLAQSFKEQVYNVGIVHVDFITCKKRVSPTLNKTDEEIGIEICNELTLTRHDSTNAYLMKQAKQYNFGLKQVKRTLQHERKLKRFSPCIRIAVKNEWNLLTSIPTQVNFVYFLLQGARIQLQQQQHVAASSNLSSTVFNGRLQLVTRVLRRGNNDDDDSKEWALMRSYRETTKEEGYTSYAFEQDLNDNVEWTRGVFPVLNEGEFVHEVECKETDTEFWIEVEVDRGMCFSQLDSGSPIHQEIINANVPCYRGKEADIAIDDDIRNRRLILTSVQGHRVRSMEDVAFAALSFHSFPQEVEEFPKTSLKFVRLGKHNNDPKLEFEIYV